MFVTSVNALLFQFRNQLFSSQISYILVLCAAAPVSDESDLVLSAAQRSEP